MVYRWKPSASQRRAFAERMKDPQEQKAYEERKLAKVTKRRAGSQFDYTSAGGNYIATQSQYNNALRFLGTELTPEQENACNQVMYSYSCQEKIHHDYIHIVNELSRN